MKLPSIAELAREARATLTRFPLVLLAAVLGTAAALILIDYEGPSGPTVLFQILLASVLGIPLFLVVAVTLERFMLAPWKAAAVQTCAVVLIVLYGAAIPQDLIHAPGIHTVRLLLLGAGMVLAVSVVPFLRRGEVHGFWDYNKTLFLRVLLAELYTCVLFAGLAIALGALHHLFSLDIPAKRYGELWVVLQGLFFSWFFLAGVPDRLELLEQTHQYPRAIKIFAQYVLLPLVVVYFIILYAYAGKILIDWDWPQGWVSKLILGFAGTGLFTILLLFPMLGTEKQRWVAWGMKAFYALLIPLMVMLFFALSRRFSQYGLNEQRYCSYVLGAWFLCLCIYFLVVRSATIKAVPLSLGILAFVVSVGPWSAFSVSEASQTTRLQRILVNNGMLVNGKAVKSSQTVSREDAGEISSILVYLHEMHGYASIQSWFNESLSLETGGKSTEWKAPSSVADMLGVKYTVGGNYAMPTTFRVDSKYAVDIRGYEYCLRGGNIAYRGTPHALRTRDLVCRFDKDLRMITIAPVAGDTTANRLSFDLAAKVKELEKKFGNADARELDPDALTVIFHGPALDAKIVFWEIWTSGTVNGTRINHLQMDIFYSLK